MLNNASTSKRIVAYIDGFNLYFGLREKGWKRYYWLDVWQLSENLIRKGHLVGVKYFTACVRGDPPKEARQQALLGALHTHRPSLEVIYGHYLHKNWQCRKCGAVWRSSEEKKTDVNIATQLLSDAFRDRFDTAFVISGDSDIAPPIELIRADMPNKNVIVAFPPNRFSAELQRVAASSFHINQKAIRTALLPNPVIKPNGTELWKPLEWK